ncbi:tubby C-terminal domain-like protein [Alkalicoccobacillus gibsonii]|uniref:tubby C-terminal domain-like protein n=1 Tax=Alkalicoccobacillus gibsonii TaxID=79881 RepID=UPI0019348F0F|nr:hypothetical protein [Alkalicoccobacillus gibsonii]MBM0067463.1 hypothetical protein [Alkalicoccobacillus gibsonii]
MNFSYTAPTIARSTDSFSIYDGQAKIGSMERFFTKQTRNPIYDVNIRTYDDRNQDTYTISQKKIKLLGETKWEILKNDQTIGEAEYPKGFFKAHQVVVYLEGHPTFTFKIQMDRTAVILDKKEEQIGSTERTTNIQHTYEGEVDGHFFQMPLILFYGLVHTFWCSSNLS